MSGILLLDGGNYSLKAALFESGSLVRRWTLEAGGGEGSIGEILNSCSPDGVAFSSVVPSWTDGLKEELESRGMDEWLEVGSDISLPFELKLKGPEKVGPDRLCAAAGAVESGSTEAVIVDVGTAVTVDLISREGFLGGAIFPGSDLLIRSLHEGTAGLPMLGGRLIDKEPPGGSTEEAIAAGIYWGLVGAVRELVEISKLSLSHGAPVWVTGGNAESVVRHLKGPVRLEPDLVFRGLAHLAMINGLQA